MKILKKILLGLGIAIGGLYTVYYFNLDMKLMRSVVLPFLNKHYDKIPREHII